MNEGKGSFRDEMDVLQEVGNISAAHGGIALSEILKKRINLAVPRTEEITIGNIAQRLNLGKIGIGIYSKIITGFSGRVLFILDEKNAFRLNDISYKIKMENQSSGLFTEMGMSLIKEVGSIVTSAYVTAIGLMFKRVVLLGPPTLVSGTIEEIISIMFSDSQGEGKLMLIEAKFEAEGEDLNGSFYMVLTPETAREIHRVSKEVFGVQESE